MTTPPKARRFHASAKESARPLSLPSGDDAIAADTPQAVRIERVKKADMPPRFGQGPISGQLIDSDTSQTAPEPATENAVQADLTAIRAEKLSERQLRIARRVARLHDIHVDSDEEAVLRLRERGIDPSHRAALTQILSSEGSRAQSAPAANTPALRPKPAETPVPAAPQPNDNPQRTPLPSRETLTEEKRAAEIYRIQRDIALRRRRRLAMLVMRLLLLVVLPTAVVGWYYFRIASPLYATASQFQIQRAETLSAGAEGGIFSGSALATNPDSVAVQSYLTSRDAMLRLDADKGFKQAFQNPEIDPIRRLPADASNEEAYDLYRKSVKIGYDPTEGMINMEVIAPDPLLSQDFSLALIAYAEEQVDQMTARIRSDQMQGAEASYRDAEEKMLAAQRRVQDLQQQLGVLDPAAEGTVVMNQIAILEGQLATKRLELGQLLTNPRPQQSRVSGLQGDIERLEEMVAATRSQLTQGNEQRTSLAAITGEMRIAESDLLTRQDLLAAAATQMESARIEANKQVRYLSQSVVPIPPDRPTYPRAFQNTLVAFLIFSGIYLMLSLTASILREQVST